MSELKKGRSRIATGFVAGSALAVGVPPSVAALAGGGRPDLLPIIGAIDCLLSPLMHFQFRIYAARAT